MIEKTNEDFGRDDHNFHPEEQRIIWETMENKEPAVDLQQEYDLDTTESKTDYHDETDNEDDSDNDKSKTQDIELDKELKNHSDQDFDKKDKSDL